MERIVEISALGSVSGESDSLYPALADHGCKSSKKVSGIWTCGVGSISGVGTEST